MAETIMQMVVIHTVDRDALPIWMSLEDATQLVEDFKDTDTGVMTAVMEAGEIHYIDRDHIVRVELQKLEDKLAESRISPPPAKSRKQFT